MFVIPNLLHDSAAVDSTERKARRCARVCDLVRVGLVGAALYEGDLDKFVKQAKEERAKRSKQNKT